MAYILYLSPPQKSTLHFPYIRPHALIQLFPKILFFAVLLTLLTNACISGHFCELPIISASPLFDIFHKENSSPLPEFSSIFLPFPNLFAAFPISFHICQRFFHCPSGKFAASITTTILKSRPDTVLHIFR